MKDDISLPCLLVIVFLALCFLFYLAVEGTKSKIETNCERYGAFYIDDQRYNCEVEK